MRVIAGEFRSRRLKSVPGLEVRPTPDRLRETLFNVLAPRIEGSVFLDAYAGTGAVGIEALSRGAARAIFIERHRVAADVIRENLESLGLGRRAEVLRGSVGLLLHRLKPDILFADPPYPMEKEYETLLAIVSELALPLVIVQHASKFTLPEGRGKLVRSRLLRQGDNALSFYEPESAE